MKDQDKPTQPSLEEQYEMRKASHTAPPSIKRHILANHASSNTFSNIFQRIGYVTAAACTLLFFGLFTLHNVNNKQTESTANFVYIHTLDDGMNQSTHPRLAINQKYATAYQAYLQQKQTFAFHHQKQATLELTQNGWQLKTCEDETMLLSNALIAALIDMKKIDHSLMTGDTVNIAFAQNGIVLSIDASNNPMQCS